MCGLEAYADAVVGSLGVEHRKRTTIGVELAAKVRARDFAPTVDLLVELSLQPKLLLFLDEPTSGLDAQSAWNLVRFLSGDFVHNSSGQYPLFIFSFLVF